MNETTARLGSPQIIESAWRDQAIWSQTAGTLKADLTVWRYRAGVAGVLGAFLETLAAAMAGFDGRLWWLRALVAIVGAVVLAVVPYVVRTKVSKDRVREWVRARSASEALKETIYRYLVGAPPFGSESSPADLVTRCQAIKEKVWDLGLHAASIEPSRIARPHILTIDDYVEKRVNDQIERYYRPKGRQNALAAKNLRKMEFSLGLIAVVIGAIAGAAATFRLQGLSAVLGPWVAVITTASAAVTAHLAASRYEHQAMTYYGTADRLSGLRDEWLATSNRLDPTKVAKLVDDCEHAISTENEAWLAEWTREKAEKIEDD